MRLRDAPQHLAGEDDELVKWLNGGRGNMATAVRFVADSLAMWKAGGPKLVWGIRVLATNELAGMVEANVGPGLNGVDPGDANIAYGLYPEGRGRGYATRAVQL